MHTAVRYWVLACCISLISGCATDRVDTFKLTADLPPGFSYTAIAVYAPAKGETCKVPGGKGTHVYFNKFLWEEYKPHSTITLHRTIGGCPLVIDRVNLEINGIYGKTWHDNGGDLAFIAIDDFFDEKYKSTFNSIGESALSGQCQWLFRTAGGKRRIVKILDCKSINNQGEVGKGRPFVAHTLDQLPGKTIRIKVKLADEERPYFKGKWVRFPNGYKRCLGKNFEDQHAFCYGNFKDFSTFILPDGTSCSIYPGCTE